MTKQQIKDSIDNLTDKQIEALEQFIIKLLYPEVEPTLDDIAAIEQGRTEYKERKRLD